MGTHPAVPTPCPRVPHTNTHNTGRCPNCRCQSPRVRWRHPEHKHAASLPAHAQVSPVHTQSCDGVRSTHIHTAVPRPPAHTHAHTYRCAGFRVRQCGQPPPWPTEPSRRLYGALLLSSWWAQDPPDSPLLTQGLERGTWLRLHLRLGEPDPRGVGLPGAHALPAPACHPDAEGPSSWLQPFA